MWSPVSPCQWTCCSACSARGPSDRDAVELPSQFMENFVWRAEVLPLISAHVESGEPLPVDMLQRLLGTRTFRSECGQVAQPVHGEFRVARRGAAADFGACGVR